MTSTLKIAWKPVIRWWITPYWRSDVASVRFVLRSDGRYILADFLTFRPFVAVTRWHRVNLKTVWRYSYAIFLRLDSACNPVFTRSTLCLRGISCRPVSVCLSVTSRSSVEMAERIEMFLAQRPTSTLYPTHCATRKFWHLLQVLPKVIWEESRRKVPISYNGTPQIRSQNCSFSSTITTPI